MKIAVQSVSRSFAHGHGSAEALAGIFAYREEESSLVDAVGILGIDLQTCEVEWTAADIEGIIDFRPAIAGIV